MPADGSTYYLRVKVDPQSLVEARKQIKSVGNLAVTANTGGGTRGVAGAEQGAVSTGGAAARADRTKAIAARELNESLRSQGNSWKQLDNYLGNHVIAMSKTAAPQQRLIRQTEQTGIATSNMIRQLVLGDIAFSQLGTEIALVATKLGLWTAAASLIAGTVGVFRTMAVEIANVNEAVLNLERLTSKAGGGFDRMRASMGIVDLMRTYNVNATEASDATFEAAKSFGNLDDAISAAGVALLASKVAEIDTAQAIGQLTQVSTAYNLTASEQIKILDKLNEQQNTLGVNIGKTLEATARAANVTKLAGGSLDELVARTAVGIRFTGFAPETVSRAQSRIAQQILSLKGQEKIIKSLSGTRGGESILEQITLPDDPTKLQNDIDLIFNTIGKNFQSLSASQRNLVAEALTGGRQGGLSVITGSLLENYALVDRQAKISAKSQGSAMKEFSFVLRTIKDQFKDLRSEFSALAAQIESTGILGALGAFLAITKSILVVANDILSIYNKLPDEIKTITTSTLAFLGVLRIIGRTSLGSLFTPGNDLISRRRRAAEEQVAERAAQAVPTVLSAGTSAGQRTNIIRPTQRSEDFRAFREFESRMAGRDQKLVNNIANALQVPTKRGIVPAATGTPITVAAARAQIGAREQAAAAQAAAAADNAEATASKQAASSNVVLEASALKAAAAISALGNASLLSGDLTKKKAGYDVQQAGTQSALINSQQKLANEQARAGLRSKLGRIATPGTSLGLGLGLGGIASLLQQRTPPGRTNVLSSTLSGAATGSLGGLIAGPAGLLIGTLGGGIAGALSGLSEKSKEFKGDLDSLARGIEGFTEQSAALEDAANSAADVTLTASEKQKRVGEIFAAAEKTSQQAVRNLKISSRVGAVNKRGESNLDAFATELAKSVEAGDIGKGGDIDKFAREILRRKIADTPTPAISPDLANDEFANALLDEFEKINRSESDAEKAINLRREALARVASEFVSDSDKTKTPKTTDQIEALRILTKRDPALLKTQQSQIGKVTAKFNQIVEADKDERVRLFEEAIKDDRVGALYRIFFNNDDKEIAEVIKLLDSKKAADRGKAKQILSQRADISSALSSTLAQQTLQGLKFTGEARVLSADEVSAVSENIKLVGEQLEEDIDKFILLRDAGRLSFSEVSRKLAGRINVLSQLDQSDPEVLKQLDTARKALLDNVNAQVDLLSQQADAGLISSEDASKRKISILSAAVSRLGKTSPGSAEFSSAQVALSQQVNGAIDEQIEAVNTRFQPLIDNAKTEAQKAALLRQQAAAVAAIRGNVLQVAGVTNQALQQVGVVTATGLDASRILLANFAIGLLSFGQGILNTASTLSSAVFESVVPEFIRTNKYIQTATDFLGNARNTLDSLLGKAAGKAKKGRGKAKTNAGKDFFKQIANQNKAIKDQVANLNSQAQQAGTAAGEDALQNAQDLLSARFELLKALAGGDEVKIAKLNLQEARESAKFAKTQAERLRARAAIINAQRELRETVFNDKVSDIDFLLQMEKISADEAARRLRGLLNTAKLSKRERQQLELKIKQYTNQAKNDRTFGLPTEIPLPSPLEIQRIVGVGKAVAATQIQNAQKQFASLPTTTAGTTTSTVNNRNNITIVVQRDSDIEKVRKEVGRATGATIKANKYMGMNPGLV